MVSVEQRITTADVERQKVLLQVLVLHPCEGEGSSVVLKILRFLGFRIVVSMVQEQIARRTNRGCMVHLHCSEAL